MGWEGHAGTKSGWHTSAGVGGRASPVWLHFGSFILDPLQGRNWVWAASLQISLSALQLVKLAVRGAIRPAAATTATLMVCAVLPPLLLLMLHDGSLRGMAGTAHTAQADVSVHAIAVARHISWDSRRRCSVQGIGEPLPLRRVPCSSRGAYKIP